MPTETHVLNVTTPLFLYGANQKEPEIRAASVRGQLHYWFRAIKGAQTSDLKEINAHESSLFGSTAGASSVSIRIYTDGEPKTGSYAMLPHKKERRGQSWQQAISPGQVLKLEIVTRPGIAPIPPPLAETLKVWLLLGGLGKRSRRMFGALEWKQLTKTLADGKALADKAKEVLTGIVKDSEKSQVPKFPTLHPDHSWVVVGTRGTDDWELLMKELFELLHNYRAHEKTFGYAMGGRRASPLIAQVREIDGQYYPVLTAMRSRPDKKIEWDILDKFMDDAQKCWNGETVWGGKVAT